MKLPLALRRPCDSADPDLFHGNAKQRARATLVCHSGCPILEACLAGAHERRERFGVWGGRDFQAEDKARRDALAADQEPPRPECGTDAAWRLHARHSEPLDPACAARRNAYAREQYQARRARRKLTSEAARGAR